MIILTGAREKSGKCQDQNQDNAQEQVLKF